MTSRSVLGVRMLFRTSLECAGCQTFGRRFVAPPVPFVRRNHSSGQNDESFGFIKPTVEDLDSVTRRQNVRKRSFVDYRSVEVRAGAGGNGCISFDRNIRRNRVPNGGNGGHGGNVIFVGSEGTSTLRSVNYVYNADRGKNGSGNGKHGAPGKDVLIQIPVGTTIHNNATGGFIADITEEGQRVMVAKGGRGGRGNKGVNRELHTSKVTGKPGQEYRVQLELKTLGDIGLVGLPNAGKSTLLRAITNARPKTAPYPFTTVSPYLGTVMFRDGHDLTVVDIPGLIEGAHENRGMGHKFLRHVTRTKVLVYVLDMTRIDPKKFTPVSENGTNNSPDTPQCLPFDDLKTLQNELDQYSPGLTSKPSLIIANKMDLPGSKEALERLASHTDVPIVAASALEGNGIGDVVVAMRLLVEATEDRDDGILE